MYLLYCDETNLEERGGDFFTYGGIAIPGEVAQALSQEIDEIRAKFGVPRDFRLKFNPGPKHLSHDEFIALKQSIIEAVARQNATLFISLILHDVATSPADARQNEINRVCYHFDCFLNRKKSPGLVLIDRFDDKAIDAHLAEKFSVGITGLPYTKEMRLSNIVGFHYSAIGQSNFASVVDILLGSIRFSMNGFTRNDPKARDTAKKVIPLLSPMLFREEGRTTVSELGIFFSPKVIKSDKFRAIYQGMKDFFAECGVVVEQTITGAHA
ncbi:hypothetical protein DLREEDagrD3_08490 [Denitratisoma sp. agr-D3]